MTEVVEFKAWPKIPRAKNNNITVTEKIDGTNACLIIKDGELVGCQSRNRMIVVGDDNAGFAGWAAVNAEALVKLGEGYHYGEWAGPGIQKNPHKLDQKTFFLFNTHRPQESLPNCVKQVSVLYEGPYDDAAISLALTDLKVRAEKEGYTPEGICIYNHIARSYMKMTYLNEDGKWVEEGKTK